MRSLAGPSTRTRRGGRQERRQGIVIVLGPLIVMVMAPCASTPGQVHRRRAAISSGGRCRCPQSFRVMLVLMLTSKQKIRVLEIRQFHVAAGVQAEDETEPGTAAQRWVPRTPAGPAPCTPRLPAAPAPGTPTEPLPEGISFSHESG